MPENVKLKDNVVAEEGGSCLENRQGMHVHLLSFSLFPTMPVSLPYTLSRLDRTADRPACSDIFLLDRFELGRLIN